MPNNFRVHPSGNRCPKTFPFAQFYLSRGLVVISPKVESNSWSSQNTWSLNSLESRFNFMKLCLLNRRNPMSKTQVIGSSSSLNCEPRLHFLYKSHFLLFFLDHSSPNQPRFIVIWKLGSTNVSAIFSSLHGYHFHAFSSLASHSIVGTTLVGPPTS